MNTIDETFEEAWHDLEYDLERIKELYGYTKIKRIEDAKIARLYAIAREAKHFQSSRVAVDKALVSGKAPTDEEIRAVRVFEDRVFHELNQLTKLEEQEGQERMRRATGKGTDNQ
jgi:hypothetical protein